MARHGQFDDLDDSDNFLTELSVGVDSSKGQDPLARLMLELREQTNAPMPVPLLPATAGRWGSALSHGLIGAAAATLVIAGSGAVAFNMGIFEPEQPQATVELAGKFEQLEDRSEAGDMEGVRAILAEIRRLTGDNAVATVTPAPHTVTHSVTVTEQPEAITEVVTETYTEEYTATVTVTPTPEPSSSTPTTSSAVEATPSETED